MRRSVVAALVAVIVAASLVLFIERSSPTTLGQRALRASDDEVGGVVASSARSAPSEIERLQRPENVVVTSAQLVTPKRNRRLATLAPLPLLLAVAAAVLRGVATRRPWHRLAAADDDPLPAGPLGAPVGRRGPPPFTLSA
ncbi:MAG: hypothetical protein S0880_03710 [Actinomycetota bacterium]|nr:hypothetical protein [Actinomycetota bacterium]